jgi:hypothetical protein
LVVVRLNVAVVEPAGTVTEAGTPTRLSAADRLMTTLPVGAALKVTVPVDGQPPVTELGDSVSEEMVAWTTVSTAFAEE